MVVRLKDASRLAEAEAAVRAFAEEMGADPALAATLSGMRAEPAIYDFRELYEWKLAARSLFAITPEMTEIDVAERRNRLVVGVDDASAIGAVRRKVLALGVPEGAVVVERKGRIQALGGTRPSVPPMAAAQSLSGTIRPVIGGVKIDGSAENPGPFECTLGYNVKRTLANGTVDSKRYFTTAAHCTTIVGTSTSMLFGQPNLFSTSAMGRIGNEFLDPPTFTISDDPFCPKNKTCRRSDLALVVYIDSVASTFSKIAWPNVGSTSFTETRTLQGIQLPFGGITVHKVGRVTGRTTATLASSCTDEKGTEEQGFVFFLCQWRATTNMAPADGDSGAPVVWVKSDGTVWSVGALWGGNPTTIGFTSTAQFLGELNDADPNGATYKVAG